MIVTDTKTWQAAAHGQLMANPTCLMPAEILHIPVTQTVDAHMLLNYETLDNGLALGNVMYATAAAFMPEFSLQKSASWLHSIQAMARYGTRLNHFFGNVYHSIVGAKQSSSLELCLSINLAVVYDQLLSTTQCSCHLLNLLGKTCLLEHKWFSSTLGSDKNLRILIEKLA